MDGFLDCYDRVLRVVTRLAAMLAGLCILATAFIIVYEIIMRGLFHAPTEWVLEISTYFIIAAGFLGLAYTFRQGAHVQVDFVTMRLSAPVRCGLEIVGDIMAVLLFLIFMTESMDLVLASFDFNKLSPSILRFPLWIPQFSLVVGSALLLLEIVRRILMDIRCLKTGKYDEERQG